MNKFCFHPVGQGLFYTGALCNGQYNFVYDCGSETSGDFLKNEIEAYANFLKNQDNKKIDFVLLSHLHRDHINGLRLLTSKCVIKAIYLPYLTQDIELMRLVLANEIFLNKYDYDENKELFEFIIGFYENGNKQDIPPYVRYMGITENDDPDLISETKVGYYKYSLEEEYYPAKDPDPFWHFKFLNRRVKNTMIQSLSTKLKAAIDNYNNRHSKQIATIKDFIYQNKLQELKNIYAEVFGKGNKLNLSSTVLIHYPDQKMHLLSSTYCPFTYWQDADITILTGDAKFDDIVNGAIERICYDRSKCVIQIPHHGSYDNWNSISYKIKSDTCYFIVPYGFGNKHRHPNGQTIAELNTIADDIYIKHVTQVKGFSYRLS